MSSTIDNTPTNLEKIGSRLPVGITAFGAWMIGVGSLIGSMVWIIHGPMIARAGVYGTLSTWALAAMMTVPTALIVAELASMYPASGGPYIYKYIAFKKVAPQYSDFLGFSTGWLYWICMTTGIACAAAGITAVLEPAFFENSKNSPNWFGSIVALVLFTTTTWLNLIKIKLAARLNNIFTIIKVMMAVVFCYLVYSAPTTDWSNLIQNASTTQSKAGFFSGVASILMLALVAFSGLEVVACTSSETENPRTSVPKAIFKTLLLVSIIYLLLTFTVAVADVYEIKNDTLFFKNSNTSITCSSLAGKLGGLYWGNLMTAGIVFSIIATCFNALRANVRIAFSMAETKLFPSLFSKLTKNGVPKNALWLQCVCTTIVAIVADILARTGLCLDAYTFLGEVFGFLYSFLATLYGVSLIILRYKEPDHIRPFRVGKNGNTLAWCMVIVSILIYSFAAFVCTAWIHQLSAVIILLSGLPIYFFYKKAKRI